MDTDQFIDQILQILKNMLENGEEVPDELMQQIIHILSESTQENLSRRQAAPLESAQVPTAPYPSSNIFGFNYDPEGKKLMIKFMGKDIADGGPVYSYEGVPPYMFDIIKRGAVAPKTSGKNKYHEWFRGKTPSHGASVYALVKQGGFPYQQVA